MNYTMYYEHFISISGLDYNILYGHYECNIIIQVPLF